MRANVRMGEPWRTNGEDEGWNESGDGECVTLLKLGVGWFVCMSERKKKRKK